MAAAEQAGATSGGAVGNAGGPSGGAASHEPRFAKKLLNPDFYSEGINYGDLDRDGKRDIIAGPYSFRGPDFVE
jgi:hypothetical protein